MKADAVGDLSEIGLIAVFFWAAYITEDIRYILGMTFTYVVMNIFHATPDDFQFVTMAVAAGAVIQWVFTDRRPK